MITVANANALHIPLADQSVQCVVTSPPYWGLRDYGTAKWEGGNAECDHVSGLSRQDGNRETPGGRGGSFSAPTEQYRNICAKCGARRIDAQIGLEATPAEYVAHIVSAMRECWRVLRDDGTLWLNLGDSYARQAGDDSTKETDSGMKTGRTGKSAMLFKSGNNKPPDGLKPKDLVGIPWRVAFALQDDGWYLRSDIIWAKPNPMPESVTDRPTKAHEYVFLLAKQPRYYYDAEAIKEEASNDSGFAKQRANRFDTWSYGRAAGGTGINNHNGIGGTFGDGATRNRRSVWTVATSPYSGAHFATFPPALVEPMILAGTSPQACEHCGAPWERVVERIAVDDPAGYNGSKFNKGKTNEAHPNTGNGQRHESMSTGWQPTCACDNNTGSGRCLVLDPFAGSGTTGAVAVKHGRRAVLLDLNTKYIDLQFERTNGVQMVMSV